MRIFNLPRGGGKSMRMVFASEFNNVPILCVTECDKKYLLDLAKRYGITIPTPITVNDFTKDNFLKGKRGIKDVLVDEPLRVLQELLHRKGLNSIGCAMSDNKNENIIRWYENGGYVDKKYEQYKESLDKSGD